MFWRGDVQCWKANGTRQLDLVTEHYDPNLESADYEKIKWRKRRDMCDWFITQGDAHRLSVLVWLIVLTMFYWLVFIVVNSCLFYVGSK